MWTEAEVEKKRAIVRCRVALTLGEETICSDCGATYETYEDRCTADLAVACPGFNRVDEVQVPIEIEVFAFSSAEGRHE
jgi:predicted amidophosphoribosyltransferase